MDDEPSWAWDGEETPPIFRGHHHTHHHHHHHFRGVGVPGPWTLMAPGQLSGRGILRRHFNLCFRRMEANSWQQFLLIDLIALNLSPEALMMVQTLCFNVVNAIWARHQTETLGVERSANGSIQWAVLI